MSVLGCGEYQVFIQERGGTGGAILGEIPWDTLTWSRVLDDTSEATVNVSLTDPGCLPLLREIRSFMHELVIYRDGNIVWLGPVYQRTSPAQSYRIVARDISLWWDHRLIHDDHSFLNEDLATIFQELSEDAMRPDNSPGLEIFPSPCGVLGTITILATQHQMAGVELRDLSRIGIDWTALGRTILAGGVVVPVAPLGTLLSEHFTVPPTTIDDGAAKANRLWVRGQGGGAAGDTIYNVAFNTECEDDDGLLESVVTISTIQDNESALAAAQTRIALICQPDSIDSTGSSLAPNCPFTIDDLIPGALWDVELDQAVVPATGQYRLSRLNVTAQSTSPFETVQPTLQPPGTQ